MHLITIYLSPEAQELFDVDVRESLSNMAKAQTAFLLGGGEVDTNVNFAPLLKGSDSFMMIHASTPLSMESQHQQYPWQQGLEQDLRDLAAESRLLTKIFEGKPIEIHTEIIPSAVSKRIII